MAQRTVARFERACLTTFCSSSRTVWNSSTVTWSSSGLGYTVILDRDQQALLLAHPIGQPAQRVDQPVLVQAGWRQFEHQRARLQRGVRQHLFELDDALDLFAIGEIALHRGEREAHAGEILRRAVVELAGELATRAFLGQRDLGGERARSCASWRASAFSASRMAVTSRPVPQKRNTWPFSMMPTIEMSSTRSSP